MKIISFEDIKKIDISSTNCYEWVSEMILNKSDAILPAKTHMSLPGNIFCNVMPSIIPVFNGVVGGVKVVTRYPNRIPSLDSNILLFNAESGEFLALMDGNWITAMRTGAVAAHSIMHLAKRDFSTIGIIGLGNTARATLLVLLAVASGKRLNIKLLKYKNQANLFIERFKTFDNVQFTIVDSLENLIKGSDVVLSCATYFENDLCSDECFDEGVLVVPVHTRGFTNCDLFFDKVYADDRNHVSHFKNFSKFKFFSEMTDVVNGKSKGRESDKERIIAYNIGVSVHDIFFATKIYRIFETDEELFSSLMVANMKAPEEKFWV